MSPASRSSKIEQRGMIPHTPAMRNDQHGPLTISLLLCLLGVGACLLSGCSDAAAGSNSDSVLVVIDAGHGGRDPGAVYGEVHEADVNLEIAKRVSALIEADERLDVRMTRTLDIYVTLQNRIAVANETKANLYLSIHADASPGYPEATGVMTLVSDTLDDGDPSWQFAEIVQSAMSTATGARDRGVRAQELHLHRAKMPAALVEVGFLSNDSERVSLTEPHYQQTIADGIYRGIVSYLEYADPTFGE